MKSKKKLWLVAGVSLVFICILLIPKQPNSTFQKRINVPFIETGIPPQDSEKTRVPVFAGEAYQMGLTHGRLFKDQIKDISQAINETLLSSRYRNFLAYLISKIMYLRLDDDLKDELQGVADGSEVSTSDIMVVNIVFDLCLLLESGLGGSLLGIDLLKSMSNGMLIGHNLDWPRSLGPTLRKHLRPMVFALDQKKKIFTISVPGSIGVLSGINEDGVTMNLLPAKHPQQKYYGFPVTLLYRNVLSQSRNLKEAVDNFAKVTPRSVAINAFIADGNDMVVLESSATQIAIRHVNERGTLYATNHFETPELAFKQETGRDKRWEILESHSTLDPVNMFDLQGKMAAAALDTGFWENTLAVFCDYGNLRILWGTEQPRPALGKLYEVNFSKVFW